ncbi:hypothetical protein ACOALZ_00580 [Nocardiopsis algeriensis]|uniref:hypothetical protein n=1 Tax=Nocardiopsis algeriensis TaxID=1478215 RepID=UPI003B43A0D0
MTIHVVSVGVSLIDFLETADQERGGRSVPGGEEAQKRWRSDKLGLAGSIHDTADRITRAFGLDSGNHAHDGDALVTYREIAKDIQVRKWSRVPGLSAELDTVRAYDPAMVTDDDLTVLLASHTDDGRACAIWTAIALAGGNVERVLYLHDIGPHTRLVRPERGQVLVVCVNGLDARQSSQFAQAMEAVGYLARLIRGARELGIDPLLRNRKEPVLFHLSGGYRATVPYLIAAAEWLRSLECRVQAHVLPKGAENTLSIPLRRLDPEAVRRELHAFGSRSETSPAPEVGYLEGYAYESQGRGARLTEFGHGMRTLFSSGRETTA